MTGSLVREDRSQLLFAEFDHDNSQVGTLALLSPTFLVVNIGASHSDGVYFAHSAVPFTGDNVYLFISAEGFWLPITSHGVAPGSAYAVRTSVAETFVIKWFANETAARSVQARKIILATR